MVRFHTGSPTYTDRVPVATNQVALVRPVVDRQDLRAAGSSVSAHASGA